ncbi:zf-HC2 domain-containing protein [Paraburkholderia sp. SARCC-3016]|jgi:predicted anti-sigma-YlaC factor YlaD|uniref:zf-HC2 domain-containing protein n=1 Tax=Paraburkholderia sp. SARCC-3016 TaxID=3058611 RepID=UPI002807BB0B|nr:zf-HC2 domain-containing protein [Paraburkholderia sp. SARCC-3016]MDQ7979677.1 zf-HC2 domain-containing protein [Paraburkholderia sp. SARCC-3016]
MGKCKDITRLLSDALERNLDLRERLAVGAHLPTCSGCRNFRRHIGLLRAASRAMSGIDDVDDAGPREQ